MNIDPQDFGELKRLLDGLPNQVDGLAGPVCETGDNYIEFSERQLTRPDDEKIIERNVVRRFWRGLSVYLNERKGRIYWRMRLETDVEEWAEVIKFDDEGPDRDFLTDRRCFLDKNWRVVQAYCRVYRAPLAVSQPHPLATPARAA
jgi:hypothetical protein